MDQNQTLDEGESLVAAMTRPSMVGGFTLKSIGYSFFLPGFSALVTRSIWPLALIPVFMLVSYLVCLKDVYLFDIADAWMRLKQCPNKTHWGCRRYAPR